MDEHHDNRVTPQPTEESVAQRDARALQYLEHGVWPRIPTELRWERKPLSKEEIEKKLGLGPDGV
jgi:hypothetical protein